MEVILNNQFVSAMTYSACQSMVAIATHNCELKAYNITQYSFPQFRVTRTIQNAHTNVIKGLTYSPNSQLIVSGGCDGFIRLWSKGRCIWQVGDQQHPQRLAIEANGVYLALANQQGQLVVWNMIQRRMSARFQALWGSIISMQFIGQSDRLMLLSGGATEICDHFEFQDNDTEDRKDPLQGQAIPVKDDRGQLTVWNWYTHEKLYTIEHPDSGPISSFFQKQWMLVSKPNHGVTELVNVWHNGDFEHSLVDARFETPRGVRPTHISMRHMSYILIANDQCQLVHSELESYRENQLQLNSGVSRQLAHLHSERTSNLDRVKQSLKRMGTQLIGIRESLKSDNQNQIRLKHIKQAKMTTQASISQAMYVQQMIVTSTEDGSLQWTNEEFQRGTRFGTAGKATVVRFSPNGQLIAVGDDEGTVTIIDTATRSTRLQAIAHENHLDFLVFLDERCLITKGKDGLIKVWEILEDTLKLIEKMPHESDTDLRVSGDLQYLLVGCNDGSLNLFRTSDWSLVQLGASQVEITAVAWAQNSDYIISANLNKSIFVTDFKEKMIIKKFDGHQDPIIALCASPNGTQFASGGYDCMIKLWSIPQRCLLGTLMGHQECVNGLRYSIDGKLLFSCSEDKTIRIWSLGKMSAIIVLEAGDDNVASFDVQHHHGLIVFTQHDRIVLLQGKKQPVLFQPLQQQQQNETITALCWDNHQNCLAMSDGQEVRFLKGEVSAGPSLKCEQPIKAIEIHHNRIYVSCEESLIQVFEDGKLLKTIEDEDCLASNTNNSVFVTGSQQEVTVWDGILFQRKKVLEQEWVTLIAIAESKTYVACCDISGLIWVWDYVTGVKLMEYGAYRESKAYCLIFARFDEYVVSTGEHGKVHIFSVHYKERLLTLEGHTGTVYGAAMLNDDRNALTCGEDGTIKYWCLDPPQMLHVLAIHKHPITAIAVYNSRIAYRFGGSTAMIDVQKDIIQNIQVNANDCAPLMQTQDLQLQCPNSILSRHLGTIFRPNLKNTLVQNEELQESMPYLNENTLKRSAFYQKIRSHILNPKLRDMLLDQFTLSEFLLQSFDDGLGYAIFNETFEMLRELNYEAIGKFVQNMFYTVVNNQSTQGTRILHEILEQQKFSCNLSMKELQYLLALIKFLQKHIAHLHNPIRYQVQLQKIIGVKKLNLSRNAYLSSILCKSMLLKSMDRTFETFRLMTPLEMFQNEHFNLYKNEEYWPKCYNMTRASKVEQQISCITHLRDKIADFKVDEYDNLIQDFILELLQELECLESIDLSFLNLTDEFCESFCNHFINRTFAPDLAIYSNERITYVGKKYLQVLYTKHKRSRLNVQNVRQMQQVNEQLKDKLKLIQLDKFRKRFDEGYQEQIDLVIADIVQLQKSVAEKLQQIGNEDHLMLNIEDYYEQQCENLKRQQVLLNYGVLGYLNEALFSTNQTLYCTYCNKYVCISCHHKPHQSSDPCMLCLKCFKYHQGLQAALDCETNVEFNLLQAKTDLYQKYKFQNKEIEDVCFYGTLRCLQRADQCQFSPSAHVTFRLRITLFRILRALDSQMESFQIFLRYLLRKILGKPLNVTQEEKKAVVFDSLQTLAEDQYNFNSNVFDLDDSLQSILILLLFIFTFVSWIGISLSLPIIFPGKHTVQWEAHIIFSGFLGGTLVFEFSFIRYMISIVNRTLEGEVKLLPDLSALKVFNFMLMSGFAKYDFYTDVIFANILLRESRIERASQDTLRLLFYLSVTFIILPCLITILQTGYFVAREIAFRFRRDKGRFKTLRLINFYSKMSYLMEHEALAWFFDKFASNTAVKIGHRYVPQKIITSFFKVLFENMPQLMLQLFYQIELAQDYNFTLVFTTITTVISLLQQIFNFMSAKSSPINDIDLMMMQQRLGFDVLKPSEARRYSRTELHMQRDKDFTISDVDLTTEQPADVSLLREIEMPSHRSVMIQHQRTQDEL